jgi:hypothetical protein
MALTEDQGFKRLLGSYPDEALALFVPELLAQRGRPSGATLLATEIPPLTPNASHRLMDLAVQFTWDDGSSAVVVLIEHWSDTARIDLVRQRRFL